MDKTTTVSIRVPVKLKERLDELAAATERNRSWLATDALRTYLELQEWQIAKVREGIRAADEGRVVAHDEVKRWLKSRGSRKELRPPRCK